MPIRHRITAVAPARDAIAKIGQLAFKTCDKNLSGLREEGNGYWLFIALINFGTYSG